MCAHVSQSSSQAVVEKSDCISESLSDWWPPHHSATATNYEKIFPARKSNSLMSRETAAIKYIRKNANDNSKILVYMDQVPLTAFHMKCLTVPITQDGVERWLCDGIMDAYVFIYRHWLADNYRPILLLNNFEQAWFEGLKDETDLDTSTEQLEADMVATAESFLGCDMVFIPMADSTHWYLVVLNFQEGEYQILNSGEVSPEVYKLKLQKFRGGIDRCLEAAGKRNSEVANMAKSVANWEFHTIEDIPKQMDKSSCGLFVMKYIQLWNGRQLAGDFTQEDVELFRTKLAEELIFSKWNEVQNVKEEIWWAV